MTPEQAQEVEQASVLFQGALVALGAQSVLDSLAIWDDVPPIPNVSNTKAVQRWLKVAVTYVMRRRIRARDMALAYYRYERALTTGTTIALPGQDNPPYMTLPELKREFESFIKPPEPSTDGASTPEPNAPEAAVPEADRIPVEKIEGLEDDLSAMEQEAEQQVKDNLIVLGPLNQDRKTKKQRPADVAEADAGRADAHSQAGYRQAAAAERNVMNGARGTLFLAADRDKRAIGYVRASRTGTPCGFCAMLISRGVVYKNAKTAGDQDLYHDNCHCFAIPVFAMGQYESNVLFALNREYHALWNQYIKDKYSGPDALNAWRRLLRKLAKSQKSQEAAA